MPGHTPYDLVNGKRPDVSSAHEFGTRLYVHSADGGKLEARADEAYFVGVDGESKGYRVYWPAKDAYLSKGMLVLLRQQSQWLLTYWSRGRR